MFYLTKDTFDAVPISVATHLKSEPKLVQRSLEMGGIIDENRRLIEVVVAGELTDERDGKLGRSRVKQPDVQRFVRVSVDSGVQPVTLVADLNHRLVDGHVIRLDVAGRL